MSKWDGRGSPETRIGSNWETEMELRAMREAEDAAPKGDHLLNRRSRARRAAQDRFDGKKSYG